MIDADEHDDIVERLYASAIGEAPWTETLARVAGLFGGSSALCQVTDEQFRYQVAENHGYSREFAEAFYASEVFAKDPRIPHFRAVRPGDVYYDHCLYSVEEMDRDPRVQESCSILGLKYQLGTLVSMPNGNIGTFTLLTTEKEGHATEEAIRAFRRLVPHIEQALSVGHILEHRAATQTILLEALAGKADGVILLDRFGVPSFMNDAASAILSGNDGLALVAGAFTARRGPETHRLRGMIGNAIAATSNGPVQPGGHMLITRPSGRRPLVVRVMPAPQVERLLAGNSVACVIHLHDLAAERVPSKALLCAAFGLTNREADLAIELVRCADLAAAAANARMALNTARNHLQSVFRKCGVSSQTEAFQLLSQVR